MKVGLVTATIEDVEGSVAITRSKERALLSLLALAPGRIVSVDRLIDGLWGDEPPRTAAKTLQTYVKNLRSRIASSGAARDTLRTDPPGYVLAIAPEDVDVLRFERLADEAQIALDHGDLSTAADLFTEALEIIAAQELLAFDGPQLEAARVRVLERRRRATDDLTDVRLLQGRHFDVIAPLTARLESEPQNERAWAQLMTALYRSDRQRDALQAFAVARDRLGAEFGLEPGPALVELEQQILRHEVESVAAPSIAPRDVVVTIETTDGSPDTAAALVDRVLEPAAALDRFATAAGHRVIVTDVDAAVRLSMRLRNQRSIATVSALQATDVAPEDSVSLSVSGSRRTGEPLVVFHRSLGAVLAARGWQPGADGWAPPRTNRKPRMPGELERLSTRSPIQIRRHVADDLAPHLDAVQAGSVRTVQVSGEAGIGKSSLLADIAARALDNGQAVLYCRADPELAASQGPIVDLAYQALLLLDRCEIDHHLSIHGPALSKLLPEMARVATTASESAAASPAEIESALVDLFQRLARNLAVVLLVDDAPLLSDEAVRVLRRLLADGRTIATCCVLACRTDDPATPALHSDLTDLRGPEHLLELRPFTTDETARFLEAAAGGDRTPRTRQVAEIVHDATRGLPLFVREIARDMVSSTTWRTADGKWRIDRTPDEMAVPQSLHELLGRRLAALDTAAQELASIGAVFGEFSTLLVATVSELPIAEVLHALDRLIEQHVVEPIPGLVDHYRFAHPLLREAAGRHIGPGRQAAIALAGAELLSTQNNPSDEQLDRRAELWFRALPLASPERVEHELRQAANSAQTRGDHGRALLHLRRIAQMYEATGQVPANETLVALAEAAVLAQTDVDLRRSMAVRAFDAAYEAEQPDLCARAALAFAGPFNPFGALVTVDAQGESMARRALALDFDDDARRAELWGMLAAALSDVSGAASEIQPALELAERCDDPLVLGKMLSLAHAVRSAAEPVAARLTDDDRILDIAVSHGDRHLELQGWGWVAAHSFEAGEIERLDRAATERASLSERLDDRIYQWSSLVYEGMRHTIAGHFTKAESALWHALEVGRLPLADHANRFFGLQLLKLSEMRGDGPALLDSTEAFARQLGYVTAFVSLAHLCVETGDGDRAKALVRDHVPHDLATLPDTYDRLPTLALLARIAERTADGELASRVRVLLLDCRGLLCVHADAVLYGSVEHNLGRCALAMGDGAAAHDHLIRTRRVYDDLDAHAWLLLLEADLCRSLALTGDTTTARSRRIELDAKAATMGLTLAPPQAL